MSRRSRAALPLSRRPVPEAVRARMRPPLAVVLGSPAEVVNLLSGGKAGAAVCYQMDLHQAEKLREALAGAGLDAKVETSPDLWDLPSDFGTAVYMPARGGERELKIDMVEQAFHVLRAGGAFIVWSSYEAEPFFPTLLKKIYGRIHEHRTAPDAVLWASRLGDRPRRRHEMTFQARVLGGPPCRFVSRPGVFSYGRFDEGGRALVETAELHPGDRVLDFGCGSGVAGVFAAQQCEPDGHVVFVDSNVRAAALAEQNARANGVASFSVIASHTAAELEERSFDVVLANPPYYADHAIARLFIARARRLLKPAGRLFLATKQPDAVALMIAEAFGGVEAMLRRGYTILCG
ncbi:MAG TPA: methyltransferase [Gemmataceae bacterium]|nr:methyltransferase [Gemmataceae bacterium]